MNAVGAPASGHVALHVRDLHAHYGESHVLHGVNLQVARGETVAILGRNGAGKSTTLKCIAGVLRQRRGSIVIDGDEAIGLPSHAIGRMGVAWCPEERAIYASLTCKENLYLPPRIGESAISMDEIYRLFPNLVERADSPGTKLSGGEQQMLAVARILRSGAHTLLLDEVSEGLAPVIVQRIRNAILELRKRGYTIVMVEQNFRFAAQLADRFFLMDGGCVVDSFAREELPARMPSLQQALGV